MPIFTGTTLLVGFIRGLWRPKNHDRPTSSDDSSLVDVPWRIKNYLYALAVLLGLFLFLIILSLYLDVKREINPDSHLSRAHSGLPLLLDCLLMICTTVEIMCLVPRLVRLVEDYRKARLLREENPELLRRDTADSV
jgi:hypothetical protein